MGAVVRRCGVLLVGPEEDTGGPEVVQLESGCSSHRSGEEEAEETTRLKTSAQEPTALCARSWEWCRTP